jgi:CRISPR system Cascade subunit CasA
VDAIFFDHLWARFETQEKGDAALKSEELRFARALFTRAESVFEAALPAIPCASIFRPRAEARARRAFTAAARRNFPELFEKPDREDSEHAA